MRAVLIVPLLTCAVAFAERYINLDLCVANYYCKQNKPTCANVSPDSCRAPSVYRANHAGVCACCPGCVTFLDEGSSCQDYVMELGETPSAVCREPFKCTDGVCAEVTYLRG